MTMIARDATLRRFAAPFVLSVVALTAILLANFLLRRLPGLAAQGMPAGEMLMIAVLALPFTLAMTVPMASFIAALRVGARTTSREGSRQVLRLTTGASAMVALVMLASNAVALPRADARLATALAGHSVRASDRTMTVDELRAAARQARNDEAPSRAAALDVEVQKKFALAAACVVLALAGAVIGLRFPRGGFRLLAGAGVVVFGAYYACLVAGESLADRLVLTPLVAMWMANAALLAATVALWRVRGGGSSGTAESMAAG